MKNARPTRATKRLIALNKPFGVLCQFRDAAGRATLADYIDVPEVYPAGRLDRDSEGLLLLTNDGGLQHRISSPSEHLRKRYLVQVDGAIDAAAMQNLLDGVQLKDGPARALEASGIETPDLWPRDPPVRVRKAIPTSWLQLVIDEGRNRQVRRMTAAVGHPTLRLVRAGIGPWSLDSLQPGKSRELDAGALSSPT